MPTEQITQSVSDSTSLFSIAFEVCEDDNDSRPLRSYSTESTQDATVTMAAHQSTEVTCRPEEVENNLHL
jgi:hypothetical protein